MTPDLAAIKKYIEANEYVATIWRESVLIYDQPPEDFLSKMLSKQEKVLCATLTFPYIDYWEIHFPLDDAGEPVVTLYSLMGLQELGQKLKEHFDVRAKVSFEVP